MRIKKLDLNFIGLKLRWAQRWFVTLWSLLGRKYSSIDMKLDVTYFKLFPYSYICRRSIYADVLIIAGHAIRTIQRKGYCN